MGTELATKWEKTKYPGVRCRLHLTRKHGIMPDKYFAIRYQYNGKRVEEGLGWATEGWTPAKAFQAVCELKEAAKTGKGAPRLADKRKLAAKKRKQRLETEAREKSANITFGEMFERYKSATQNRVKDWQNYQGRYDVHLGPIFGQKRIKDITVDDLVKFKGQLLEKRLATATVRHILGVMRQTYNWAIGRELYSGKNPFAIGDGRKIIPKMSKLNNRRLRVITSEEENRLIPELLKRSLDVHDMAIISLYSGLRYMEIALLKWLYVDIEHRQMTIIGKGEKERTVPIHQKVNQVLIARYNNRSESSPLVFPTSTNQTKPKMSKTFPRTVKELGLNNGITDRRHLLTFHTLRHTFATRLAEAGTPLTVLRDLLGHRDLEMVSRYAKSSLEQAAARVAQL